MCMFNEKQFSIFLSSERKKKNFWIFSIDQVFKNEKKRKRGQKIICWGDNLKLEHSLVKRKHELCRHLIFDLPRAFLSKKN